MVICIPSTGNNRRLYDKQNKMFLLLNVMTDIVVTMAEV